MSTPESTPTHLPWATLCQSRLYPPVRDFGFGLRTQTYVCTYSKAQRVLNYIFLEDQAFSMSCDLAPPPIPSPLYPVSKLTLFLRLPVCRRSSLLTGEGGGGKGKPNHTTARKPCPLLIIQYYLSKIPCFFWHKWTTTPPMMYEYVKYNRTVLRVPYGAGQRIRDNFSSSASESAPLCHEDDEVYSGRHRHPASRSCSLVSERRMTEWRGLFL
jgi:hypothetical protein